MSQNVEEQTVHIGLMDVVASTSSICFIDGQKGRLLYRGYDIVEMVEKSTFEEVAYLLWYGRLPTKAEFERFLDSLLGDMQLPAEMVELMRLFPKTTTPIEALRTAVSALSHWDPEGNRIDAEAGMRIAARLTQRIPLLVAAYERLRQGQEPVQPIPGKSIAYNFLYCLHGQEPPELWVRVLDVALVLHADHEFNASTFVGRGVASTLSDMYSAVTAAIGALKGPLHGGANEQAMKMLFEIGEPSKAEAWVKNALANKVKVPGFGHRVYRTEDPRATILRRYAEQLTKGTEHEWLYQTCREVERTMLANSKVFPNVDLYSGICYHTMRVPAGLYTPIFAISRTVGWTAHILEQWSDNKLIRPRAKYIGPDGLSYVPIEQR
ncbi:MAG: citrate/2-methylcitrate synthase [Armatimonadota bacterium]|nr:citrate synthase [bacterium]MCS7309321.1 citrate synthase [Armatimonadota bacterium]MDW8104927.1 citrate/2-methylcitrate synthase [Armatimonadota bacterium]MDW8289167.1 citrate/2-methylcitrate synthase [Armatimonadota bacterium]